ncbi:MAG: hypothetical protein U5K56_03760 [Halioglobus sp.]|nr:hypothetical protein [Halioglobus sp.]
MWTTSASGSASWRRWNRRNPIPDEAATDRAETLREYCRQQIARYKVPAEIRFVDSLPRNAMNKVVKPQLVELFEHT